MEKPKHRDESFDVLKGIAIYLVVMGHVLTMCIRGIDAAVAFKLIGEIHMPVFFFISGYFAYKASEGRDFLPPDLWKRFKQLIIPFFAVSALWMAYFPYSKLLSPLSSSFSGLLVSYWKDGYWFTLTLFELILVYALLGRLLSALRRAVWQALLLLAVYVGLIAAAPLVSDPAANYDPIGIGLLARFLPIYFVGMFARKHLDAFRRLVLSAGCFPVAAVAFFASWYYVSYSWEFPSLPQAVEWVARPALHVSLMLMVFSLVYKAGPAANGGGRAQRWLACLGNNSLGIYLLHYFFLFPLTPLQEPLRALGLAFVPTVVVAAFAAFFIVAAALGATWVAGKNPALSFLIGKETKINKT